MSKSIHHSAVPGAVSTLKLRIALGAALVLSSPVLYAQEATNYMTTIGTSVGTGLTLALNIVRALVFIIMVWSILTKYAEASRGRASWGEVFLPLVVGAVVLALLAIIGPDAETAIGGLNGAAN